MAISVTDIVGGSQIQSFQQMNQSTMMTGMRSAEAVNNQVGSNMHQSYFGHGTSVGTGPLIQENKTIVDIGSQKTSETSDATKQIYQASNFGNDTKIGTGVFQQSNKDTIDTGMQATSTIMQTAMKPLQGSNFGVGPGAGSSDVAQMSDMMQQRAERAYQNALTSTSNLGGNMDISA